MCGDGLYPPKQMFADHEVEEMRQACEDAAVAMELRRQEAWKHDVISKYQLPARISKTRRLVGWAMLAATVGAWGLKLWL
jgi:hypothetical protein